MKLKVYLSGEIHTNWRDEIIEKCKNENLDIEFSSPTTNHELSDDIGVKILGKEDKKFWHDNKGAKINSIKTRDHWNIQNITPRDPVLLALCSQSSLTEAIVKAKKKLEKLKKPDNED